MAKKPVMINFPDLDATTKHQNAQLDAIKINLEHFTNGIIPCNQCLNKISLILSITTENTALIDMFLP